MSRRLRSILLSVLGLLVVAGVALGGWALIEARAESSGRALEPVSPAPSGSPTSADGSPTASPSPSAPPSPTASPSPVADYWLVARLNRKARVYGEPNRDSRRKVTLPAKTPFGLKTVCLVRKIDETPTRLWYNVWLPTGPNGARGWIGGRGISVYPVYTQIVIDLSERRLTVLEGKEKKLAEYPVAVGMPDFPTPTGRFFITEKVRPVDPSTAYGVLALALSAYSPQLADEPEWAGGQVAIHGTNAPQLIGQAVSHGCIRMKNGAIRKVSALVETGSPVTIKR